MIALLFPGQGAQRPGMLHALADIAGAQRLIERAADALRRDVLALDRAANAYASTADAQVALFVSGVACANALAAAGVRAHAAAGHSVGAFGAAVACGALAFEDALRLVDVRGRMMAARFPHGYGMGAIGGLDERTVDALARAVATPGRPVFAANVNAPDQIAVAGESSAVDAVLGRARERGARSIRRLAVNAPSHTPLMRPVADALERELARIAVHAPALDYAANATGRIVRDAAAVRTDLSASIARPVQWANATRALYERGVRLFVEMRPGTTLSDLATHAFPEARAVALETASVASVTTLARRL